MPVARRFTTFAALAAVTALAAPPAMAHAADRKVSLPAFHAIAASGNLAVDVVDGQQQSVEITGDGGAVRRVQATVTRGELRLTVAPDPHPRFFGSAPQPHVAISLAQLDDASLAGACVLSAQDLSGPRLAIALAGASRAMIAGSVTTFTAALDGASHLSADNLITTAATLSLAGASQALVHATGTLKIAASGASRVVYFGTPTLFESLSGVASVHRR